MKYKKMIYLLTFYLLIKTTLTAATISDNNLGYTISLPDGWVEGCIDSNHHIFEDTTDKLRSLIGIKVYDLQEFDVPFTPKEWTRTNFLGYYLWASVESTNVVVYCDTLLATEIHNRFTADIYTYFFDVEGSSVGNIAEYVRYTAVGNKGYEIYVIGPLSDMDTNLIYYLTIIETITITTPIITTKSNFIPMNNKGFEGKFSYLSFQNVDLLGRNLKNRKTAFQLLISVRDSYLLRKRLNK